MSQWFRIFLAGFSIAAAGWAVDYFLVPRDGDPLLAVGFALGVVGVLVCWLAFAGGLRGRFWRFRAVQRERQAARDLEGAPVGAEEGHQKR